MLNSALFLHCTQLFTFALLFNHYSCHCYSHFTRKKLTLLFKVITANSGGLTPKSVLLNDILYYIYIKITNKLKINLKGSLKLLLSPLL